MPTVTKEMGSAAADVLNNEIMVGGESVHKFEEEFAEFIGSDFAASVNSGSSAILLTFRALGLRPGEKIIVPSATFIATLAGPTILGATPVFCEIGEDYVVSTKSIADIVSRYSCQYIMPVHLYGYPCDMSAIREVAESKRLTVIEDVAQAHGARFDGRRTGSFGEASIFSFYPTKNMTVGGDGGMVTTNNKKIYDSVVKMRDVGRKTKYTHDEMGYTLRLNTMNAAIGRIQLRHLEEWNGRRRDIASSYNRELRGIKELALPQYKNGTCEPVYHIYAVRTRNRNLLGTWLHMNGVATGVHYPIPVHKQPACEKYQDFVNLDFTEEWSQTVLSLPMYPHLTEKDQSHIIDMIQDFYDNRRHESTIVKEQEMDWARKLI